MLYPSLNLSSRSLRQILHNDLNFHSYKVQMVQELRPADPHGRTTFCRISMNAIEQIFGNRIISRNGDNNHWPPRSPDLLARDFFLWGFF